MDHKELKISVDHDTWTSYNIANSTYTSAVLLLSNGMILVGGRNLENRLVFKKPLVLGPHGQIGYV